MPAPKGNKYGKNGGHPPLYKSGKELDKVITKYFKEVNENKFVKPTVSGLAHYLGYESRQSIYDLEERKEFSYSIKRAILKIEEIHESGLFNQSNSGHIFWLKNRGWKDKQETEHSGDITITRRVIK